MKNWFGNSGKDSNDESSVLNLDARLNERLYAPLAQIEAYWTSLRGTRLMPLRSEIYVDEAMASVQLGGRHARVTAADYQSSNPHVEGATP